MRIPVITFTALITLTGCASMIGGSGLEYEVLRKDTAWVIGEEAEKLVIESRESIAGNTYYVVRTPDGVRRSCSFFGGGFFAFGMRSAPVCNEIRPRPAAAPVAATTPPADTTPAAEATKK